jgi:DNA mismatch endonuclease, patch repair protein
MADVVDSTTRSRMMSGIRSKDTKPELIIRRGLHRLGFRFRVHDAALPGKPDLVFPKYRAVIFVHGCFWHGHGCSLFKWPSTRPDFWKAKIDSNVNRDKRDVVDLQRLGWRTATIWECACKGKGRLPAEDLVVKCCNWLKTESTILELMGDGDDPTGPSL